MVDAPVVRVVQFLLCSSLRTSGIISVCSALCSTVDTCIASVTFYVIFYGPLFLAVFLFGVSPEEYMIWTVWEMISGILSVCSALGSTVDTCSCQSTKAFVWACAYTRCSHWEVDIILWRFVSGTPGSYSSYAWLDSGYSLTSVYRGSQVQFLDKVMLFSTLASLRRLPGPR